jgi:hypothetical protein
MSEQASRKNVVSFKVEAIGEARSRHMMGNTATTFGF